MLVINPHFHPMLEYGFSLFMLYSPSFLIYCTTVTVLAVIGLDSAVPALISYLQPAVSDALGTKNKN